MRELYEYKTSIPSMASSVQIRGANPDRWSGPTNITGLLLQRNPAASRTWDALGAFVVTKSSTTPSGPQYERIASTSMSGCQVMICTALISVGSSPIWTASSISRRRMDILPSFLFSPLNSVMSPVSPDERRQGYSSLAPLACIFLDIRQSFPTLQFL